ncbi:MULTISPECIES: acyl carrier protein [unclassified Nonomuraea]|uniref:acyl carrier protein n=1 Tax=unclassified Nonomuraea TaxID=2593643 RepID=UPI00273AFBC9|nr:acyl carrier protein [Nonomuraea sp. G32]MDP4503523.1 acyl carrier protein [Nonomuraea sp. G32]
MTTATIDTNALRQILTANLGLDEDVLDDSWDTSLAELGVDSIGVLELQTVIEQKYRVALPETAGELSPAEIYDLVANGG